MAVTTEERTGAEEIHWDLSSFYTGDPAKGVESDLNRAETLAKAFAEHYSKSVAGLSPTAMVEALHRLEEVYELLGRAGSYAGLNFTTDVSDSARGALYQKAQEGAAQIATYLLFFNLEWIDIPDEPAQKMIDDPQVASYRHYLAAARRYKPFVLSEPEERALTEKSVTARSAWDRLFEEVVTAVRVQDNGAEITLDQALARLHEPDQKRRAEVANAVTDALRRDLRTRRFILNTILVDKSIDDRLHRYPHWIADRNLANEASDESVAALIDAVTSRYDITHRYYELKKKVLGLDHFYDYDRYAPYGTEEPQVEWETARDVVLDAYGSFSPRFREAAQEFFDQNWIDAALAPDKRGGAFAHQSVPSHHPFVMLNYTGKRRDVLVMAHELGHGVHMSLSRGQSVLNFDTPLTTAETASIFGETVTFGRVLSQEEDPRRRLALLFGRIDDAVASIYRQVAMNRFEDAIHNARRDQGELSEEHLNDAWLTTQRAMLGPAVEVTHNYSTWWSYIPHFIGAPGYVYAYAFGNLLALAIYRRYEEEGASFAPKYLELLAAGGSDTPEALTRKVGVDLGDPKFWHGGLETISRVVDQAEELSRTLS
jgi:oligoendopeptidase F